ncbi:MAG: hypothetical protein K2W93_14625 [Burkholderiaceae bacterium]|nr:hypothetical protein [Burkholderiaceae bacterium]
MTIRHNAPQQAARLNATGRAVRRELATALPGLVAHVAATMRQLAPKDLSVMANTVKAERRGPLEYFVAPTTDYAKWVDAGRKPGKGLPLFAAGLPIVEWLRRRLVDKARAANPKFRKPRAGSRRAEEFEEDLKARYLAFSRHVKAHGLKAHPFVKPTADANRDLVHEGLIAAVRRGIAAAAAKGGAA